MRHGGYSATGGVTPAVTDQLSIPEPPPPFAEQESAWRS
jgi:hypothetical protein